MWNWIKRQWRMFWWPHEPLVYPDYVRDVTAKNVIGGLVGMAIIAFVLYLLIHGW